MNTLDHLILKLLKNEITRPEFGELRELISDDANLDELKSIMDDLLALPRAKTEGLTRLECEYMIDEYRNILLKDRKRKFPLTD